jgi:hypothetical protein
MRVQPALTRWRSAVRARTGLPSIPLILLNSGRDSLRNLAKLVTIRHQLRKVFDCFPQVCGNRRSAHGATSRHCTAVPARNNSEAVDRHHPPTQFAAAALPNNFPRANHFAANQGRQQSRTSHPYVTAVTLKFILKCGARLPPRCSRRFRKVRKKRTEIQLTTKFESRLLLLTSSAQRLQWSSLPRKSHPSRMVPSAIGSMT